MASQNITLSISIEDAEFLREHPQIKASQLFRRACQMFRAHELDIEVNTFDGLIDEIVKQRNAIAASRSIEKQLARELKELQNATAQEQTHKD